MVSINYPFVQATLVPYLPNLPRDWILMKKRPSNQTNNFQIKKNQIVTEMFFLGIFIGKTDKKIDFSVIMHYKCRLRYGSTHRIKSKNILVRFPSGCGFKYPVPQLRYQAIENDSSTGFMESVTFMVGAI